MSGHFDDEQLRALSPSEFRRQREAAGIRDTDATLDMAYALATAPAPAKPALIQIGPLDV